MVTLVKYDYEIKMFQTVLRQLTREVKLLYQNRTHTVEKEKNIENQIMPAFFSAINRKNDYAHAY